MQRLDLRCLGLPEFRLNGRPVELALRKAVGLVVFLAEAGGPVARETAATLLWPDADEATSKARLRRLLHRIRAAFGKEIVAADRTSLRFQPTLEIALDSRAFERDCDRGDLDAAAGRYRGDFLAGLSLAGCPELEEWAFFRREALRSRLMQALERLIAAKIASGEPRAAVAHATRLVGLDPLSESAHRHLMRAHLASGNPAAAKRQLEACARSLGEELGVAPDAATVALLEHGDRSTAVEAPRTRYGWPALPAMSLRGSILDLRSRLPRQRGAHCRRAVVAASAPANGSAGADGPLLCAPTMTGAFDQTRLPR